MAPPGTIKPLVSMPFEASTLSFFDAHSSPTRLGASPKSLHLSSKFLELSPRSAEMRTKFAETYPRAPEIPASALEMNPKDTEMVQIAAGCIQKQCIGTRQSLPDGQHRKSDEECSSMKFLTLGMLVSVALTGGCAVNSSNPAGEPLGGQPPLGRADRSTNSASAADIPGTPAGTVMTKEYVETVARMAYVWGWPLVNNYNRALGVAKLPEPGRIGDVIPGSPPGQISMLTDYIRAEEKFVTCPNQDTVYGAGFQRLNTKPVIVQVPDFGDRFFTYQIVDARTDSFAQIGKQYGTKPGFYLIVGPNWKGETPAGVNAVFQSSTDLCAIFPRAFQDDTAEDRAAIQPVLNQIVVYPLSEFDGKMRTKDWKTTPAFPAPPGQGEGETKWVVPEKFFDELPTVMNEIPPLPGEESMYVTIRSVLDAAAKDPKIKEILTQTAVASETEVITPLFYFHNNGQPVGNGWTSPPNGAKWGFDYLSRAATAKSNMFDNAPQETRYIYTDFDSTGVRLNGDGSYTVTFPKDQTPPVKGFWSLTLYNKEHLFSPNTLNRYSLGTKSKSMKLRQDGSLTLYVQANSPGADKESNWLPAPKGEDFSLYIRAYWPDAAITDGKWIPPVVVKASN
jgi:hypothetical protein